ncbi:caspase family protein [Leptolyngbya sp. PCC 6406]|uniref:caspase family protein n=1 Tax=Leptolyngbya sp. PCC 6406 TaxID=1173264 RepID=UPI0002AD160B|nr:caspase family protein [Leptolyngbya sp. PCC 6406]
MTDSLSLEQRQAQAAQTVRRFVRRFQPAYRALACHAALPLVLTPELVNYLRNEFLRDQGVPWVAEVDLLLSDLCQPVGYELYALDTDVRAYLFDELKRQYGQERIEQVAKLLISYVRYLAETNPQANEKELEAQQWAAMVYLNEEQRREAVSQMAAQLQIGTTTVERLGDNLVGKAELARLAEIALELAPQLADYPALLDYAALVRAVVVGEGDIAPEHLAQSYEVLPGQTLRLPEPVARQLKVALLIGVSEYTPDFASLPSALNDIQALKQVLEDPELGGFDDVKLLSNPDLQTMQSEIESFLLNIRKADLGVLYFSGYGLKTDLTNKIYLATSSTRKDSNNRWMRSTAVSFDFIYEILQHIRIGGLVIILDCCFSGAINQSFFKADMSLDLQQKLEAKGHIVLTSCSPIEYSLAHVSLEPEEEPSGLSLYTHYLVRGINTGEADIDQDGYISFAEIHEYISQKLQANPVIRGMDRSITPQIIPINPLKGLGTDIRLSKVKTIDPIQVYRALASEYHDNRGSAGQIYLKIKAKQLGLSEVEIISIEEEILFSTQQNVDQYQRYENILRAQVLQDGSINAANRKFLEEIANSWNLNEIDIQRIEAEVIQSLERTTLLACWWKWYFKMQDDRPLRAKVSDLWFIRLAYHLISRKIYEQITKAQRLYDRKQFQASLELLDVILEIESESIFAYYQRALVKKQLGYYEGAIADLNSAIRRDADNHVMYYERGLLKIEQGDREVAISDLTQAIDLHPQYGPAYYRRGKAHFERRYFAAAIADYQYAIQYASNQETYQADAYFDSGRAHFHLRDYPAAIDALTQAIALDSKNPEFYRQRAYAYDSLGQQRLAKADFDTATRLTTTPVAKPRWPWQSGH